MCHYTLNFGPFTLGDCHPYHHGRMGRVACGTSEHAATRHWLGAAGQVKFDALHSDEMA